MEKNQYQIDLEIDPDNLEKEWLEQPRLMMRYAEACANAQDDLRRVEQRIKVTRSRLILEASDPHSGVLGKDVKPNAQNVEAYYRNHPEHKAAKEEYLECAHTAEMLQNAVFAFQARKLALENLVVLHGRTYYARPNAAALPAEDRAHMREVEREDVVQRQRRRLNPPVG